MLGLSIARVLQITEAIGSRRKQEFLAAARISEWQTRTLAQFVAAAAGKGAEGLQKQAAKVSMDLDGDSSKVDTADGAPRADDPAVYVEQGSQTAQNPESSLAGLTRGFR